jgi:1-acyl-sn-glycerol-3-phosphate acyltransferase
MKRSTLRLIVYAFFKTFTRLTIIGLEKVPRTGGVILAVNHLSRLDPPLVFALIDREKLTALVAEKYKKNPFFSWIVRMVDGIYINRGEADLGALRQAREYLQAGGVLGIAPEGTRSHTGSLILAKTGVAYLADKAGVPVIPAAISGTDESVRRILHLRRPDITIQFGEPVALLPISRGEREGILQRNTDEIMCRIAAMLPEKYHGVYANHPRLRELLGEGVVDANPRA